MAFAFLFFGCDDEIVNSELVLDNLQTANIEVFLWAELDNKSLGMEKVPNGTKVLFSVDYEQYNAMATGKWVQTVEVSDGKAWVEVPANNNGVEVLIDFEPFVFSQVQPYNSSVETKTRIYTASSIRVYALPNLKYIKQVGYNVTDFGDNTATVNKTFKGQYIAREMGEVRDLPMGTNIRMYTNSWTATVQVGYDGKFNAVVPYNEYIQFEFIASYAIDDDNHESRKFRTSDIIDSENWNYPIIDLYFGQGQTWE